MRYPFCCGNRTFNPFVVHLIRMNKNLFVSHSSVAERRLFIDTIFLPDRVCLACRLAGHIVASSSSVAELWPFTVTIFLRSILFNLGSLSCNRFFHIVHVLPDDCIFMLVTWPVSCALILRLLSTFCCRELKAPTGPRHSIAITIAMRKHDASLTVLLCRIAIFIASVVALQVSPASWASFSTRACACIGRRMAMFQA